MAGRMIVAVTKANPGVKKAKAATGRAVRVGAVKSARAGAQIMARGRRSHSGGERADRSAAAAAATARSASARRAGRAGFGSPGGGDGRPPGGAPGGGTRPAARGPAGRARGLRRALPGKRRGAVAPRKGAAGGPASGAVRSPGPGRAPRPATLEPARRRPHLPSLPRPRRPLVRRRRQDVDEGGRRRRLRLPLRSRGRAQGEQKPKKSRLHRIVNARKRRRWRRLRRLLVLVAVMALFVASMGMFGAASSSKPEGAGGLPLGFVDGIPYAELFNGAVTLGVDPRLLAAIAFAGSGFDTAVISCARSSPSGRVGVMHLLPDVAAGLGVDPCDPAQVIPAAARYLLAQHTTFGTWELAVAAYHAGPSAVATFGGIPPFPETLGFVPNVVTQWNAYMAEFPSGSLGTEAPYGPLGSTARYTESRITPTMQHFLDVVVPIFGQGHGIGCFRNQEDGEHPQGRACDFIMQRPLNHMPTQQYLEHGWAFVNYVIAHAPELKLRYVIWQKQIWQQGIGWGAYTRYDPYGNLQQNHYDHVHVTVNW